MEVYIVYRVNRASDKAIPENWAVYDNELEALRECNHWNADKGVYYFYTIPKNVLKIFEI